MRLDVFLALMPDLPITEYRPRDLQLYVNKLQWLPLEYGREGKHSAKIRALGPAMAIERNKAEQCWEPMARKTMEDGYLQVMKAVINDAVRNGGFTHPLAGARIAWPKNAKPSVAREALDDERLNAVFRLCQSATRTQHGPKQAKTLNPRIGRQLSTTNAARRQALSSGSSLTFESLEGFPAGSRRASLRDANRHFSFRDGLRSRSASRSR